MEVDLEFTSIFFVTVAHCSIAVKKGDRYQRLGTIPFERHIIYSFEKRILMYNTITVH